MQHDDEIVIDGKELANVSLLDPAAICFLEHSVTVPCPGHSICTTSTPTTAWNLPWRLERMLSLACAPPRHITSHSL